MAAKTIKDFLLDNPIEGMELTIKMLLKRAGVEQEAEFKLGMMQGEDLARYQKKATPPAKKGSTAVQMPSSSKLNELIIINHCLEPDFSDAAWIEKAGCRTPEELLYKVLKPGEITSLASEIFEFSGLGSDIVLEQREEIKNS
ncbi:hypothetical protein LJB77_02780 [Ruminococcaceae bacterium OttesenSCG-928-N02]|nr:hypothetical protein [Ruminococcaceae bacterium OttesenSCG-928-N02]